MSGGGNIPQGDARKRDNADSMFYVFLYPWADEFPVFNVFRYLSFRTIYAVVTAFVIAFAFAPMLTRRLHALGLTESIRDDGPERHTAKRGTPTMGGILIVGAVVCSTLLWADLRNTYIWLALFTMLGFGVLGIFDDYRKGGRSSKSGLAIVPKLVTQLSMATAIGIVLYLLPGYSTVLNVPFFKTFAPDLGWLYVLFAILVIVAASNAVNLTDGLDGLAIGPVMVATVAYTVVVYVSGHVGFAEYLLIPYVEGSGELAVFTGAMFGASLAFLWFNTYPASIFMGDVGSLPLGAALGLVAIVSKHELLLILVGGVFVIETVSVIFQVVSYRSRGKRIFLMAPIHHHFELKGWEEPKIVIRLWIIAIFFALLSLSTMKLR